MISFSDKPTVFIDVDDTLVSWSPTQEQIEKYGLRITCPESIVTIDGVEMHSPSWAETLVPNFKLIEQIKAHKLRGHIVIIWSSGGASWCKAVVEALEIQKYVDLCVSKPMWIYDDLPASEFMPENQIVKFQE